MIRQKGKCLLSDRKYRQRGYQDTGEKREQKSSGVPSAKKDNTFGPKPLQMPGRRNVSRCSQCGTVLQEASEPLGQCSKCGFDLHSCKQCTYFDPSSRFECMQPVPERVPRKDVRNECTFYSIRVMVEKETSTPASAFSSASASSPSTPDDARRAFENLFKK